MTTKLGGAGGGGSPTIVKDNVRSQDSVEFIMGICEGPIAGLIDGPKSFYLGDTALVSQNGDSNFEAFEVHMYHGAPNPTKVTTNFGGTASNIQVGVELAQYVPVTRQTPAILRGSIDRLEVRMAFSQMVRTNDDGDQLEATAEFLMKYRKASESTWRPFNSSDRATLTLNVGRTLGGTLTTSRQKSPLFGNLKSILNDDLIQSFSMPGSTSANRVVGSITYNRVKTTSYGKLWFNTTTGQYDYEINETAADGIASGSTASDTYTVNCSYSNTIKAVGYSIDFSFELTSFPVTKVTAKTGSTYVREYVRKLSEADRNYDGDWEIQIERLTTTTNKNLFVKFSWESFQCVNTNADLQFENLAVIRGLGAGSNQFSSLPTFSGVYAGKIIKVPSNYDPVTRVYSGVWDGTFKQAFTDNPAWCLYDLIMDTRYGLKYHIPNLQADRYSFYDAAQWCDELVPRGDAFGYQPRYTYNDLIDQSRNAMELAQYIASIFGGILTTNLNGTVVLKVDRPGSVAQIFGPENISIDGFQYQMADITTRVNDMTVTFVNPDLNWNQDVRQLTMPDKIERNGRIPQDFVAVGCIDAYEAERRAWLRMLSANTEITTVSFSTTRVGLLLEPYDIIGIVDPNMNWGMSGRIKSVSGNTITLRDEILLIANADYTMTIQGKTGPLTVQVQNTGGAVTTQLTRTGGDAITNLPSNAQFALSSDGIGLVKPFRVLSIQESTEDADSYSITAIEINVNKYGDADNLVSSGTTKYSYENSMIPKTPRDVVIESGTAHLIKNSDGSIQSRIYVAWEQDPSTYAEDIEVYYKRADYETYSLIRATGKDCYIPNVQDGRLYNIMIKARNAIGRVSPPTTVFQHTVVGKSEAPSTPSGLTVSQVGSDVRIDWNDVTDADLAYYEIRTGGTSWETATKLATARTSVYTAYAIVGSSIIYRVKAVDTSGNYSTSAATVTYTVPNPGQPGGTINVIGDTYQINIDPPANVSIPVAEYLIKRGTVQVFRGAATTFSAKVNWVGTQTFTIQAINTAGTLSNAYTLSLTVAAPVAPTLSGGFTDTTYILSWNPPAATLPIVSYVVRNKTGNLVLDSDLKATTYSIPIDWLGAREFEVWAVDSAGNVSPKSTITATVVVPTVANVRSRLFKSNLELTWSGERGTLPIKQYFVRYNNATIATVGSQIWSTPVDWNGTRTYSVIAEDMNGNQSAVASVTETVDPPTAPSVSSVIVDKSIRLTWTEPTSELRVREYEVWRDSAVIQKVSATTALVPINYSGSKTYQVRAVDEAGNLGAYGSATITINAPSNFAFTTKIVGDQVTFTWSTPTSTLPIAEYILVRGASNTLVTRVSANSYSFKANWTGLETFKIQAVDIAGNTSAYQTQTLEITNPTAPTIKVEVLDNNVMLRWSNGVGTLPVTATEIRRGTTFATATVLQTVDATFAPFFEYKSGTYSYWVVNIDSAGNYGTPTVASAVVNQPPDYVLQADYNSSLNGTTSLCYLASDGMLYFGVDTAQTYQQHWTVVSNTTIQDQIDDGYPLWLQPTSGAASTYEEIFDYGTLIASSLITVTPTIASSAGDSALSIKIEARATTTDAWTLVVNGSNQGFANNFRYVRFTLTASGNTRDDLIVVSGINLRLNSKLKTDSGNGYANAADTGGTTVTFSAGFIDVQAIAVTPLSTTARYAVYDFVDVPYPTSFKVLMFDQSGNRVSGNFSWSARGF